VGCFVAAAGCGGGSGGGSGSPKFLSFGTAPVGGAFPVVGGAIAEVLNDHPGDNNWKIQAKGTRGSQENIRLLKKGDLQLALSNAAISYFAVRGESSWKEEYDLRAIATLAPNVALFITKKDSGLKSIADLKGKNVCIGPGGAGFEMFVAPILEAHGVTMDDIKPVYLTQSDAVEQLGDGSIDAAFLGGAVPTSSISQAASSFDLYFIPFDPATRDKLIADYPFFHAATIPAKNAKGDATYRGMEEDFEGLNVGSMHMITYANADEELVYQLTKSMWENREEIAGKHPAGKAINPKNVARYTGTDFHPGAIRFYKEAGVWPEDDAAAAPDDAPATDAPATDETPATEPAN